MITSYTQVNFNEIKRKTLGLERANKLANILSVDKGVNNKYPLEGVIYLNKRFEYSTPELGEGIPEIFYDGYTHISIFKKEKWVIDSIHLINVAKIKIKGKWFDMTKETKLYEFEFDLPVVHTTFGSVLSFFKESFGLSSIATPNYDFRNGDCNAMVIQASKEEVTKFVDGIQFSVVENIEEGDLVGIDSIIYYLVFKELIKPAVYIIHE